MKQHKLKPEQLIRKSKKEYPHVIFLIVSLLLTFRQCMLMCYIMCEFQNFIYFTLNNYKLVRPNAWSILLRNIYTIYLYEKKKKNLYNLNSYMLGYPMNFPFILNQGFANCTPLHVIVKQTESLLLVVSRTYTFWLNLPENTEKK